MHGVEHLEVQGKVPDQLKPIQERLFAERAKNQDADYIFDIPVEVFVALGGIRYDADLENGGPQPWQVLTRIPSKTENKWWWPFG